jgi:hypothetical protein
MTNQQPAPKSALTDDQVDALVDINSSPSPINGQYGTAEWRRNYARAIADAAVAAHVAQQVSIGYVTITQELATFLLGEGPFDGAHFGDLHTEEEGSFWWRKHLRACIMLPPQGELK